MAEAAPSRSDDGVDRELTAARARALRAGPVVDDGPVRVMTDDELDAPLEADLGCPHPPPLPRPDRPPVVGGFDEVRLIRHGGQATVFEAVQSTTGQRVALKVLHGGPYVSLANRRRLDREVRALAAARHPNVARIVDRGRTADGSYFVATPFVDGRPLDARAAELRAAGDGPGILRLFARVAGAVAAVHALGVVHRDLSPSNVLVDAGGEPHLIDFGLAKFFDPARQADEDGSPGAKGGPHPVPPTVVTAAGQYFGSLPWASPEQVGGGGGGEPDARADVYSIGVLLYQALTGRYPYRVEGVTITEVIHTICYASPARPSRCEAARGALDWRAIDAVVLRALAKARADRYPTAADLLADLERLLAGEVTDAAVRRQRHRAQRFTRVCAVVSAVGLTLGAAGVAVWTAVAPRDPPVVPVLVPEAWNGQGMRLVRLSAGEVDLGSPTTEDGRVAGEVRHRVRVPRAFWIGATEVTRGQYLAVTRNDPSAFAAPGATLPMTGVTLAEAEAFCRLLGEREGGTYRLPSEAEWEYACRAGETGAFAGTRRLGSMGWYAGNSGGAVHPVGGKSPNHWGLHDLHGNAREWTTDPFAVGYELDPGQPPDTHRPTVKGGGYASPEGECRSAFRDGVPADRRAPDLGFRVVRE